ncbi:TIGR00180 family glycosyltransferase, partial [Escherichia coli]|uniref:TIGR00180 family glycosyltransferase n=1 Tax=Escherichia coli TaxID=562 RepID=UPI003FA5C715
LYPSISGPMCLKELIGIVEEKYVAFSGDDDFLVPRTLSKCIDFLENHPEYRTVQGKGISFELSDIGPYGTKMAITPYYLKYAEEDTPSERLQAFLANYWVPLFSVHRTPEFLEDHANLEKLTDIAFTEIMANCCTIIGGKSKLLDDLYVVRQCHSQRHLLAKYTKWVNGEQWKPSYEIFSETLKDALVKAENISSEDALS